VLSIRIIPTFNPSFTPRGNARPKSRWQSLKPRDCFYDKFQSDDLDNLYSNVFSDSEIFKYVGNGQPATREETESALISIIAHWQKHGFGRWAAIEKASNRLIGFGGLRSLFGTPELVYHFAKPHWGKGLGTELASAALKYGFDAHGFARIVAIAKPANAASMHVMKKVGMRFEKLARYYEIDVVQYEILRHEFDPGNSSSVNNRNEHE
jgi:ribosomal-protein-alanine N-acetyltransferase